eukprot:7941750-Lingulodinium_polyedra.AAC.1
MRSNRPFAAAAARELRVRTLHARARKTGARVECTSARFVSRCGGERSIRPHLCAACFKRCAEMRSNR